jgi:regulator of replication initiation timing
MNDYILSALIAGSISLISIIVGYIKDERQRKKVQELDEKEFEEQKLINDANAEKIRAETIKTWEELYGQRIDILKEQVSDLKKDLDEANIKISDLIKKLEVSVEMNRIFNEENKELKEKIAAQDKKISSQTKEISRLKNLLNSYINVKESKNAIRS